MRGGWRGVEGRVDKGCERGWRALVSVCRPNEALAYGKRGRGERG